MIECNTLYGLHVPHTAFPNATRSQLKQQQQQQQKPKVRVTKIGTDLVVGITISLDIEYKIAKRTGSLTLPVSCVGWTLEIIHQSNY